MFATLKHYFNFRIYLVDAGDLYAGDLSSSTWRQHFKEVYVAYILQTTTLSHLL